MKKYGGFIPGIRPGRPTAEYLQFVLFAHHVARRHVPGHRGRPAELLLLADGWQQPELPVRRHAAVLIMVGVALDHREADREPADAAQLEGFLR